jgi:cytochrome c biogenesis protein CcmG/thiol:disulfide interchange protein DsbE
MGCIARIDTHTQSFLATSTGIVVFEAVSFEECIMKVWTNLSTMALLTLVSTWGLSGCSKKEPAVTRLATDKKDPSREDEHAKHGDAKKGGTKDEEHARHHEHRKGEHKRGEHKKGEHKDHKQGEHHGKALTAIVKVGDKVPDFSVRTLDGKTVKLSEMQKNEKETTKGVVVLSFWCTTCHSCRHVEPALGKLSKDYEGQAAVVALDANADDTAQDVAAFVKKNRLALPIVLDPTGGTADLFGVQKTTTTVVIDGNRVLRYCGQFRQKGGASAEEALKAVLAGKEVAMKITPHNG